MMRFQLAALALALAAPAAAQSLDMTEFFAGRTHGDNQLRIAIGKPKSLVVDSVGSKAANGSFVLIDTVREEGKPTRQRRWVMKAAGPGRYTGTLSDAVGPVDVRVQGRRATVHYVMKGGLKIDQTLDLQPDGKTLRSHATIRKLGIRVARVDGTVRKLD